MPLPADFAPPPLFAQAQPVAFQLLSGEASLPEVQPQPIIKDICTETGSAAPSGRALPSCGAIGEAPAMWEGEEGREEGSPASPAQALL